MKLTQHIVSFRFKPGRFLAWLFCYASLVMSSAFAYVAPVVSRESASMGPTDDGSSGPVAVPQAYDDGSSRWQSQSDDGDLLSPAQQNVSRETSPSQTDQIEALQQEIRELRGQLEVQNHNLKKMEEALDAKTAPVPPLAKLSEPPPAPDHIDAEDPDTVSAADALPLPAEKNIVLSESDTYQKAQTLLKQKQYTQAASALQVYLERYPKGQYSANAHYWLGELLLIQGNNTRSLSEFNVVVTDYPLSPKAPDAMLKLGLIYADQGNWDAARQQLTTIKNKFPGTSPAQLAEQRLRQLDVLGH